MQPGDVLASRFRLTDPPIGAGDTGVVWPAVDEGTGLRVAVKVLHAHLAADPDTRARLQAAAAFAGAKLPHPALLEPLGVFAERGSWFLVTERFDGVSLDQRTGNLGPMATLRLGVELAGALAALHRSGRIHGDVRPGNVLYGAAGARLIDSGFGRPIGGSGELPGRPGQTAPEVLAGAAPGPGADLYGLGVVLYRALAGRHAWTGPTPWAILGAQRSGPPPRPPGPHGLAMLVTRLIDPDPRHRPVDAAAVVVALQALAADPTRPVDPSRRWLPPLRRAPWAVHGVDPATGAPALIRANLGRRRAAALAARLRADGWQVEATREALGPVDLAWFLLFGLIGWGVVPLLGLPLGLWAALWWRRRGVHPELRQLPPAKTVVPPVQATPGAEEAVVAGLLLLLAAGLLPWWPSISAGLLAGVLGLAWWTQRRVIPDEADRVSRARLETAFVEVHRLIDHRPHALDAALALEGEAQALERAWRVGDLPVDEVVVQVERLRRRAASAAPLPVAIRASEDR